MLVRVRILGVVTTNAYGDLMPDTELRTSAEFARHLVDDCKAAEYIDSDQPDVIVKKQVRKRKANDSSTLSIHASGQVHKSRI